MDFQTLRLHAQEQGREGDYAKDVQKLVLTKNADDDITAPAGGKKTKEHKTREGTKQSLWMRAADTRRGGRRISLPLCCRHTVFPVRR